jgi:hypothetical protein
MTSIEHLGVSTRPCRVKSLSQAHVSVKKIPQRGTLFVFLRLSFACGLSIHVPGAASNYDPIFTPMERSISGVKRCLDSIIPFQGSRRSRLFQLAKSDT